MNHDYINALQNEHNAQIFMIESVINGRNKCGLARVMASYPDEKKVDIKPLVLLRDKDDNPIEQSVIYGVSYFRLQYGNSAIIIDPVVGDIGFYSTCDKDTSRVIDSKAEALPPTNRRDSLSDAIYFGSIIGETPTQYIKFSDAGIDVVTPNHLTATCASATVTSSGDIQVTTQTQVTINASSQISLSAPIIALNGTVTQTQGSGSGNSSFANAIEVPDVIVNGKSTNTHTHPGVESGPSNTGEMQ